MGYKNGYALLIRSGVLCRPGNTVGDTVGTIATVIPINAGNRDKSRDVRARTAKNTPSEPVSRRFLRRLEPRESPPSPLIVHLR